jgi:hypothetical protein
MKGMIVLVVMLAMISCGHDDQENIPEDLETEIIEMNWSCSVKDLYIPEVSELQTTPDNIKLSFEE